MREITVYTFGMLKLGVRGLGVYTGGQHLQDALDKLSLQELRQANQAAWTQKRAAARRMNLVSNVSAHGCLPHDRAGQHYDVAEVVVRETWKRIVTQQG